MQKIPMTNKEEIYTLVGHYQKDNTFITTEGITINCISYGIINKAIDPTELIAANFKWSDSLNEWLLFQYVKF